MTVDLDAIKARIRKLSERTTERGFTEAEAMQAADMLSRVMAEHGLSMSDIEIRERDDLEEGLIDTGRKRAHEVDYCATAIAAFCDCKVWRSRKTGGNALHFFGFPEDVAAAKHLYQLCLASIDRESARYLRENGGGRRAGHAFRLGMAQRISQRLGALKAMREDENKATTGRALVPVKMASVNQGFAALNLKLKLGNGRGSRYSDRGAFGAGQNAGERFNVNKSVGSPVSGYLT